MLMERKVLTLERGRVENHETPSFTIDKMVAASRLL